VLIPLENRPRIREVRDCGCVCRDGGSVGSMVAAPLIRKGVKLGLERGYLGPAWSNVRNA
jgi:hypothetical protein